MNTQDNLIHTNHHYFQIVLLFLILLPYLHVMNYFPVRNDYTLVDMAVIAITYSASWSGALALISLLIMICRNEPKHFIACVLLFTHALLAFIAMFLFIVVLANKLGSPALVLAWDNFVLYKHVSEFFKMNYCYPC